ncbi:1-acyl-sn-glycerol-3-phosphate acyltransferase epsilon-like [Dreissena polymorpha]|nr:1-acyl-sn-glycerol-3-phosphate acyltransferase epsilon-like [Dreissena polymorpha]
MILSVLVHTHNLRWTLPLALSLGSSPIYISVWAAARIVTFCLPRSVYTYTDDRLYSLYQRLVLFIFNTYSRSKVKVYGNISALRGKKENVIFICNHQCTVDWAVANMIALPQGSIGRIRYILKDGLKYFPLYGFYFSQHSCIFVKTKDGKFNEMKARTDVAKLKKNNIPVWMVLFPEGTRMSPARNDVLEKRRSYTAMQGLEPLSHVLMPKVRGLQLTLDELGGHVSAVYDLTIAYSNTVDPQTGSRLPAPDITEFVSKSSPEIHLQFERIPIKEVPSDENGLKMWLYSRFQEKERLLAHFYSSNASMGGRFPGESQDLNIPASSTLPSFLFFTSCLAVLLSNKTGRDLYWKTWLFGSIAGCLWMAVRH